MAERVLAGDSFVPSTNEYDWLGHGVYFWEANPLRGLEFATEMMRRPRGSSRVAHPAVVGAVIDLALCLDLTTSAGIEHLRLAYGALAEIAARSEPTRALPVNVGGRDRLRRNLDCAVVNTLHEINRETGRPLFDTVKGVFIEGGEAYPGAGFAERTHIQICVRNAECIKGVFRVRDSLLASQGIP